MNSKLRVIKGKKAMSPLLVTIFLVAFAVALGAMVMSWGSGSEKQDASGCDEVKIEPQIAFGKEMICFNENTGKLKIIIKNEGTMQITNLIYRKISPDFSVKDTKLTNSNLRSGQIFDTEIIMEPGRVQLELIPEIKVLGDELLCSKKALVRENIPKCEN